MFSRTHPLHVSPPSHLEDKSTFSHVTHSSMPTYHYLFMQDTGWRDHESLSTINIGNLFEISLF